MRNILIDTVEYNEVKDILIQDGKLSQGILRICSQDAANTVKKITFQKERDAQAFVSLCLDLGLLKVRFE